MTYIPDLEGFSTRKMLGQIRPSNTSPVSIYSPPTGVETIAFMVTVVNHSNQDVDATFYVDDDGTTYNESTMIAQRTISKGSESEKHGLYLAMNDENGNIAVQTSSANDLTFTIWGKEYDLS